MPYNPTRLSGVNNIDELRQYLEAELNIISKEFNESIALDLRTVHVEPGKPREGMIVSADGTDWDPGDGAGAYEFIGGVWRRLSTIIPASSDSFVICGNGGTATVAGGGVGALGPSGFSATEANVAVPVPVACTAVKLSVVGNDPGGVQTAGYTLRKGFADTALVATIPSGTNVASATGSIAFAAGDRMDIVVRPSATSATQGPMSFGVQFTVP